MSGLFLIHSECSARCFALIKHCELQNIPHRVINGPSDILDEDFNNPSCFLFILNENDIVSKGAKYITRFPVARCVFPTCEAVELEASKIFCRQFLECNGLGKFNPNFQVVYRGDHPTSIITDCSKIVLKADGLASGKGVFVGGEHFTSIDKANAIVATLLEKHPAVLVEEKLVGQEFSVISLCWQGVVSHFPVIKDFKRRNNGDTGPNTGGMGTISFPRGLAPFLSVDDYASCCRLNEEVAQLSGFNGFLYGSFMKLDDGGVIKLIEYNVRPGDSEAVNMFAAVKGSNLLDHLCDPLNIPLAINNREYTFFRYLVPASYAMCKSDYGDCVSSNELGSDKLIVDSRLNVGQHNKHWYPASVKEITKLDYDIIYQMSQSRAGGIFTHGTDLAKVISDNDSYLTRIIGRVHYRTDIAEYFFPAKYTTRQKFNYIGHIDNYNTIIGNIKTRIDESNGQIEIDTAGAIQVIGQIGDFANSVQYTGFMQQSRPVEKDNDEFAMRIICSVDGAGTKTKFLEGHPRRFQILGSDIVVHNLNDMYCNHGKPIALLDYFGCDKLDKVQFGEFIQGALEVCRRYGIALIGGETAEMRGIYQPGEVEVLGILLGVVPVSPRNGVRITKGNWIYGIPSNGAHTNGYTKLREIDASVEGGMPAEIKEFFSQPHKNYIGVVDFIAGLPNMRITGRCHITGGGFLDNIERVLPSSDLKVQDSKANAGFLQSTRLCQVQLEKWPLTREWQWLFDHSGMDWDSFIRVFNAGYGFCIITEEVITSEMMVNIEERIGETIRLLGKII